MTRPYYKDYPRDFFEGTIGMDWELKCVYGLLLKLIYMRRGKLEDDAGYICGHIGKGYTGRRWAKHKKTLIEMGKIEVIDGFLTNNRAQKEEEEYSNYQSKQSERAKKRWNNRDLFDADASENGCQSQSQSESQLYFTDDQKNAAIDAAGDSMAKGVEFDTFYFTTWLDVGADFEKHIMPALRHGNARKDPGTVSSWAYFDMIVKDFVDGKLPKKPQQRGKNGNGNSYADKQRRTADARREATRAVLDED